MLDQDLLIQIQEVPRLKEVVHLQGLHPLMLKEAVRLQGLLPEPDPLVLQADQKEERITNHHPQLIF